jgi:hypothetical protein
MFIERNAKLKMGPPTTMLSTPSTNFSGEEVVREIAVPPTYTMYTMFSVSVYF